LETQVLIAEKLGYVKSIEPIASRLTPHASLAWSLAGKAATSSALRWKMSDAMVKERRQKRGLSPIIPQLFRQLFRAIIPRL
jgi:hypothetical protein